MGDLEKRAKDLGLGDGVSKALGYAENGFSYLNTVYGAYSTGKSLLTYLGIFEEEESPFNQLSKQIDDLRKQINDLFRELEEQVLAASELNTREKVCDCVIDSQTAITNAVNYVKNPNSEFIQEDFAHARSESEKAAETLKENYWERVYSERALYNDPWDRVLYPPVFTPARFIWDYRLALPAYLEAIAARVFVLLAAGATYHEILMAEVRRHAEKLLEVYNKILSSFYAIPSPDVFQMKFLLAAMNDSNFRKIGVVTVNSEMQIQPIVCTAEDRDFILKRGIAIGEVWRLSQYIYGVVETYTGSAFTGAYPREELIKGYPFIAVTEYFWLTDPEGRGDLFIPVPKVQIQQPELYNAFFDQFFITHTLRTWRKGQELYIALGLPKLRDTIQHLYSILGQQSPEIPVEYFKYTSWSVRQVYSMIPDSIKGNPEPGQPITLRNMATMLETSQPISLRQMLLLNE